MDYLALALAVLTVLVIVGRYLAKRTKTTLDDKVVDLVEKYGPELVKKAVERYAPKTK